MKTLLLLFGIDFWSGFLMLVGIAFICFSIRFFIFPKFFEKLIEKKEKQKEEKAKAKWKKLLNEKDFNFFTTGDYKYNYFYAHQIKDLIYKYTDVIETIKISNLNCYSWPEELNEKMERRFTSFLESLSTRTLPTYTEKILKLQTELLGGDFEKSTTAKNLLLSRLVAKVNDLIENKFEELEKDKAIKEDWISFFETCTKLWDSDEPILISIGRKINQLS